MKARPADLVADAPCWLRQEAPKDRSKDTLLFASDQSLSYLTGEMPADYGFDPLGLLDPEGKSEGFISPSWLRYSEVVHARSACPLSSQHSMMQEDPPLSCLLQAGWDKGADVALPVYCRPGSVSFLPRSDV